MGIEGKEQHSLLFDILTLPFLCNITNSSFSIVMLQLLSRSSFFRKQDASLIRGRSAASVLELRFLTRFVQ